MVINSISQKLLRLRLKQIMSNQFFCDQFTPHTISIEKIWGLVFYGKICKRSMKTYSTRVWRNIEQGMEFKKIETLTIRKLKFGAKQ